jgi:integrase
MTKHTLFNGKLHLYKRPGSSYWQCSTYLLSKQWRASTKEEELPEAEKVAEDWYLTLRARAASGKIKPLCRFREAAAAFYDEYTTLLRDERSAAHIRSHADAIRLYLNPFFGDMAVDTITSGTVMDFRVWRANLAMAKHGKPAARQTLKKDIVTLRLVLRLAVRKGWIDFLPDLSEPFPTWEKPSHRAWFSNEEYAQLCQATWAYVQKPPSGVRLALCQQLHDYVVFMANTGLRPDEASNLEFRDVVIDEEEYDEPILVLSVRGKRGVGYCKSMPSAARAYRRLLERHKLANSGAVVPTASLFPLDHRLLFNRILAEQNLKIDREGRPRSAYSLRHTYVCLRLLNGADIYQLAKNCRTSVAMIEKYYARHISTAIDTTQLNVGPGIPGPY